MLRRLLNSVMETNLQSFQPEGLVYSYPFTKKDLLHLGWLSSLAPCYPIAANNINILYEPQQFYDTLLQECIQAKQRITLVSLYIGNGNLEAKLISTLLNNKSLSKGELKLNILLDYTRGSRYEKNSRVMLQPLLQKHEDNCNISLYHTPILRGLRKLLTPHRWNELFGLQHMKLYIFDNTVIISGANLSNDYFTNRQDRYFVIKDKGLSDFYNGLVDRVQCFSLNMDKHNNVSLNSGWSQLPYEGEKMKFIIQAKNLIENYLLECRDEQNICKREGFGELL